GMEFATDAGRQNRDAVFGAEYEMHENTRQGLWHGLAPIAKRGPLDRKRDDGMIPRPSAWAKEDWPCGPQRPVGDLSLDECRGGSPPAPPFFPPLRFRRERSFPPFLLAPPPLPRIG